MDPTAFVTPCLLAGAALYALRQRVDVFSALPYATITGRFSFFEMLGVYGFLVLCLIYMKIREPKVLLAALTLLLIISVKILIELFLIAGN